MNYANYPLGQSGSFFTLRGFSFPITTEVSIQVGDTTIGTVTTNENGEFAVVLSTANTAPGTYEVIASSSALRAVAQDASASTQIVIADDALLREREASSDMPTLDLEESPDPDPNPGDQNNTLYLPVIRR